jgi:predicted Zn-dependent protease
MVRESGLAVMSPTIPSLVLRLFLACWLALQPWIAAGADTIPLPDLGDESMALISPTQERRLGEDFMRKARGSLRILDDPELADFIQKFGMRLVTKSDAVNKDFKFFLIEDPTINAFAVPGGFVGVHTGLILSAQNESEVASVLAHEIAHVTQRHIPRLLVEEKRSTLPAMAALLASILLASAGHRGGEAGFALTTAAMAQQGINFTRQFEEEADRIGMGLLARSGYDPRAMPSFFEKMQAANRYNETSLPEYLRTHPVTTNRIADSRNRAEQYPPRTVVDSNEYFHARAKLRALAPGNPNEIVNGFRENLTQDKARDLDAERYGYVIALTRAKQLSVAREEIQKLVSRRPERPYYRTAQADIELAAGRYDEALTILRSAYQRTPNSLPLARHYASVLLKTRRPAEAAAVLKPFLRDNPDEPALYKMMAEAAGDAGQRVEAHRAMAEYYYLSGNPNGAIQQLQLASRFAGENFYLQSSIEARLNAIKEEMALYKGK